MVLTRALTTIVRNPGLASAAGLAASGLGIALDPRRAGEMMRIPPTSARGVTEMRAGIGGTFAALGTWAMLQRSSQAYTAVGVTWLGAALVRTLSIRVDDPETDWSFWTFLAGETVLGVAGVLDRGTT
jgi:hypothetical protein